MVRAPRISELQERLDSAAGVGLLGLPWASPAPRGQGLPPARAVPLTPGFPRREQWGGGQHRGAEGAAARHSQPHDPEGKGAPGEPLLHPRVPAVACQAQPGQCWSLSSLTPAVPPQTRRCTRERPEYAPSSSEDEDPAKDIGVTYKSTRSAVRTGSRGAWGVSSGGAVDLTPHRQNLPL